MLLLTRLLHILWEYAISHVQTHTLRVKNIHEQIAPPIACGSAAVGLF